MPNPGISEDEYLRTVRVVHECGGSRTDAARILGLDRRSVSDRIKRAGDMGIVWPPEKPFEIDEPPGEIDVVELVERRKRQFEKKRDSEEARRLIDIRIKIDGPIGVCTFGDPHTDDNGTDIIRLERDAGICRETEGMFAANCGDVQNNWIGRLSHLWSEQSTSAVEAWALTEWFVGQVDWLYMIGGNHDCWSGEGDPLRWIMRARHGLYEPHGIRVNLKFPNGKEVRVNARHDFAGHSMWNTAHGPAKAAQMGWRDHILTCGHKHVSGYQVLKDPATGLVSHAIRCGSYKTYDRYAKEKGLPNQNIFPSAVTIIDPRYADDDCRLITTLFDVEEAADYLTWKRTKGG